METVKQNFNQFQGAFRLEIKLSMELASLARLSLRRVYTTSKFSLWETYEEVSREKVSESSRASIHTGEISWQLSSVKTTCLKSAELPLPY